MNRKHLINSPAITLALILGLAACSSTNKSVLPAEPTVEYFKLSDGKLKPWQVKINAYFEVEKENKYFVFISPKAKEEFEKSGKEGKNIITGIGFGPNGETVIFESEFAQKEYERRHK